MKKNQANNSLLQVLPSVDSLLKTDAARKLCDQVGRERLIGLARQVTEELRAELVAGSHATPDASDGRNGLRQHLIQEAERRMIELHDNDKTRGLQRVINASGVILHTNLGRAPLSEAARDAMVAASGYCTLEYNLATGSRGRRGARAEDLLAELTEAEGALVVNNCAAAALLILSTLAPGG